MQALKLAWLGTRTGHLTATVELFRDVLGLELVHSEAGFAVLDLPDGGRVEVFGEHSAHNRHFTHPVAGFLVDDLEAATATSSSTSSTRHRRSSSPRASGTTWRSTSSTPRTTRPSSASTSRPRCPAADGPGHCG